MKKITATFIIILSFVFSELHADHASLVPYIDGNKCGYADRNLKIIVEPQYDTCGDMIDGMASVYKNGRDGFINEDGKIMVKPFYIFSTSFNCGYAVMSEKGKYIVIDASGKEIISSAAYTINSYHKGVAVISKDHKCGLMDKDGMIILPVKYREVKPAGKGLFIAADPSGKYFLYNSSGRPVVKEEYDLIHPAAKGFMMIRKGDGWGFLNPDGAVVAPAIYENIRNIKSDGSACIKSKGKWGVMNGQGKIIAAVQYDGVGGGESTMEDEAQADLNYFTVLSGGKWGIISLRGETIAPAEYYLLGPGGRGYIPALKEINNKSSRGRSIGLTLLDDKGWELFKPRRDYNIAGEDGEGLLPAGKLGAYGRGKLMGYVNHQGEPVIGMTFEEAGRFERGYAIVKKNGLYGIINKIGVTVEEAKYDDIKRSLNYPGLFQGSINGRKVYFEPGGKHFSR